MVERDLIRERMLARLKAAEARGRKGGRKPAALVASGTPGQLVEHRPPLSLALAAIPALAGIMTTTRTT